MKTIPTALLNLCLLLSVQELSAQMACSDPTNYIYGVDAQGDILPINVNNAAAGSPLTSNTYTGYPGPANTANGLALRILTGVFYYFHRDVDGDQSFVSFDPVAHVYKTLSPLPSGHRVVKACITADGSGYYCIDGLNNLCYYDIMDDQWTVIGSNLLNDHGDDLSQVFTDLGSGDMAIDARGRLWIIVSSASKYGIYCLAAPLPTSGQSSVQMTEIIPPTRSTPKGDVFAGIAFDPVGQIHMSTEDDLYLLQSDLTLVHVAALSNPGSGADLTSCNFPFLILAACHVDLTAKSIANKGVSLKWSVRQVGDIAQTELYRSRDGSQWQKLVTYIGGMGATDGQFTFTDADPGIGKVCYKVCVVNNLGKTTFSEVRSMDLTNAESLAIWPIPVQDQLHIQTNMTSVGAAAVHASIYSSSGQMVKEQALLSGTNIISMTDLGAGIYMLRITYRDGSHGARAVIKR